MKRVIVVCPGRGSYGRELLGSLPRTPRVEAANAFRAALGRPTLGLFGPTEWWLYGPWGPKTRTAASNETRGQFAPIEDLTVDHVFEAVLALHDAYIAETPAKP